MKICIPTCDDGSAGGEISAHLGSAPFLTILDSATGDVEVRKNAPGPHGHGACRMGPLLKGWGVKAVVAPRLGRGALEKLTRSGVAVLACRGRTVAEVAKDVRRGPIPQADEDVVLCRREDHSGCESHSSAD